MQQNGLEARSTNWHLEMQKKAAEKKNSWTRIRLLQTRIDVLHKLKFHPAKNFSDRLSRCETSTYLVFLFLFKMATAGSNLMRMIIAVGYAGYLEHRESFGNQRVSKEQIIRKCRHKCLKYSPTSSSVDCEWPVSIHYLCIYVIWSFLQCNLPRFYTTTIVTSLNDEQAWISSWATLF